MEQPCHIFGDFCSISVGPLYAGASAVSGTICKYLWVCFTRTRTPQLILFSLSVDVFIQQRYKKKKCIHFQPDCLSFSLSLSGILMVSMNNILQVSSRSSLALPRRKLSNSRQVIPLRSLECSKSCSERFIVNGKKHAKKKRHTLQSRCDCNHKLTLMPCHQDCDCVSSDFFFFFFFVSPFLYFFFFSSGERFCQRQVHQPG